MWLDLTDDKLTLVPAHKTQPEALVLIPAVQHLKQK